MAKPSRAELKEYALLKIREKYPDITPQGANALLAQIEIETSFYDVKEGAPTWSQDRSRGKKKVYEFNKAEKKRVKKYNKDNAEAIKKGELEPLVYEKKKADLITINKRLDAWKKKNKYKTEDEAEKEYNKLSNKEKNDIRYEFGGGVGSFQTTPQSQKEVNDINAYVLNMTNPMTGEKFQSYEEFNNALDSEEFGWKIGMDFGLGYEAENNKWNTEYLNKQDSRSLRKRDINPYESEKNATHVAPIHDKYASPTFDETGDNELTPSGSEFMDFEGSYNPDPFGMQNFQNPLDDGMRQDNTRTNNTIGGSGDEGGDSRGFMDNRTINNNSDDFVNDFFKKQGGNNETNIIQGPANYNTAVNSLMNNNDQSNNQNNNNQVNNNQNQISTAQNNNSANTYTDDGDIIERDIIEVEKDDPDVYPPELGEKAREYIEKKKQEEAQRIYNENQNLDFQDPTGVIDPDANVDSSESENVVKEENETDTRENFENNPTEDILSTSSINNLFGTFNNTAEAVTTGAPTNSGAYVDQLTDEAQGFPKSDEKIQETVDSAVEEINVTISEKEADAGVKYVEGETKIKQLEPKFKGGASISIDGMEFHSGGSIDPGGQGGKREDYVYGPNHEKYVAGKLNFMSPSDIKSFDAKLWFVNFDNKKQKLYSKIFSNKELAKVKKEGYTSYVTRQQQLLNRRNTGYVELVDNEALIVDNDDGIDYDVFDYQAYVVDKINIDAEKRNKDFEAKLSSVMVDIEKEMNSEINQKNEGLEKELLYLFRRRQFLGEFEGYTAKEISDEFYSMANKEMRDVQENVAAKYQKNVEEAMKEWEESYKIPNQIDQRVYDHVDELLDSIGFFALPADQKRNAIDNIWVKGRGDQFSGLLAHMDPEKVEELKQEFYAHYYQRIAFDEAGNLSPFSIRDFATNALQNIDEKISEANNAYNKSIEEAYKNPDNLGEYEELIVETPEMDQTFSDVKSLEKLKKFSEDILNNPESFSDDAIYNFWKGFSGKRGHTYIPFVGALPGIMDIYDIYQLSKKDPKTLSEAEKEALNIYALREQSNARTKDLSPSYRRGSMLADMIPYVFEFIGTSGTFTATRAATKAAIKRGVNKHILTKAKYASVKGTSRSAMKKRVSERAVNASSWLIGTAAQTSANPQQYVKHFIENLTPEMQFVYTSDGDEIVDLLDKVESGDLDFGNVEFTTSFKDPTGDNSIFTAAWRAMGVTYAEFTTERMGELIPMFGKYFKKNVLKNPEWLKRASLGYYLHKKGLSSLQAKSHFMKNNVGWNGILGEVFEEVINQPISSVIMGRPWDEGLDTDFVKDMFTVTGVAQVAFGGISMGHQLVTGKKPPTLMIGYQRYDSYTEFKEDLDTAIKNGTLGDQKVKVTGNPIAFFETEDALKAADKNSNFDRAEFDKARADRARRKEIEILNKLSSTERKEVLDIEEKIQDKESQLEDLKNEMTSGTSFTKGQEKQKKQLENEIQELYNQKGEITFDVAKEIIEAETKEVQKILDEIYKKNPRTIKAIDKNDVRKIAIMDILAGVNKQNKKDKINEVYTLEDGKILLNGKIAENEGLLQNEQINEMIKEMESSEGFISRSDGNLYINVDVAAGNGRVSVAAHELLHSVLAESLNTNPQMAIAMGNALKGYINSIDFAMVQSSEMMQRLKSYREKSQSEQSEEALALFTDAIRSGDIQFNENVFTKIGDIIRRVLNHMGLRSVRFRNGRDVYNFLKDFNSEVANGKLSAATAEVARKGVKPEGAMLKQANKFNRLIKKANKQGLGFKYSKPIEDKSENKDELFANSNRALDEAMELSHGIKDFSKMTPEDQAVEWNKLSKDDKLIIGYQVGLEWQLYTLKHIKLKLTEDAGVRTNEDGVKDYTLRNDLITNLTLGIENENGVPFMVNTWNPLKAKLTTHLYGLIPLRIPAAARQIPGFFSIKVSEEKGDKQSGAKTKKKEESKGEDIKLYEYPWVVPFNDKTKYPVTAKEVHLAILELIKQGKIDISSLNSYKDVRSAIPQEILDMVFKFFGIKPKPGNLTKSDIKNAQLKIEFNYNFIFGNFPQGYNSENKSTGTTNVLMTERPTKKNKLKKPKNVFYEELETPDIIKDEKGEIVEVKTKAKRPTNLKIQRKIKNPGKEVILGVFGITETKGSADNLYKKEDNTSSRIRAVVMEHVVLFVNQAVVEVENNPSSLISQALNDGKAPFRFSKGINEKSQVVFEEKRPELAKKVVKSYNGEIESILYALDDVYSNTLSKKEKNSIAKQIHSVIKSYSVILQKHKGVGSKKVVVPLDLEQYINEFYLNQNEETAIFKFFTNMGLIKGVKNVGEGFLDIKRIVKARAHVINFFNTAIKNKQLTVDQAVYYAQEFFKGMLAGATKIADGRIKVDYKTGTLTEIPQAEWKKTQEQRKKDGKDTAKNRKQYFASVPDFVFNMLNEINGVEVVKNGKALGIGKIKEKYYFTEDKNGNKVYKPGIEKSYSEKSETALNDPYGEFNGRKQSSEHVRDAIELFMDYTYAQVKSKKSSFDYLDLAMMATSMGSGMTSIMRKAANLAYISSTALNVPIDKRGSKLEYEHMVPQVVATLRMLASYINDGKMNREVVFENYHVAIIPSKMDTTLTNKGFRSKMPLFGNRYYNMFTFGEPTLDYLVSLDSKHKGTDKEFMGKDFVEAAKLLKLEKPRTAKALNILAKAYRFSKKANVKNKGITVLDFDDTLATSKSLIEYTTPEGAQGTLTPAEYASNYQDLLGLGYKFDFSQFNLVVEGKIAPLFQKALKLQKKFGPSNMFVLTARPAESAQAIYEFLKGNGLNIPLKNITGLANSTAEAKALWIAEKAAEGYNDFYFADDALQNVQAVKNMLDQFDVKSKVQQAKVDFRFSLSKKFNDILEDVTGIESKKQFGKVKAAKRGKSKGKFRPFVPPGAEDFVGLLYNFMGKGKKGEAHRKFFEDALLKVFNEAYLKINTDRQRVDNEYRALRKLYPEAVKMLGKKSKVKDFTNGDAIRVYLWVSSGYEIPGLSKKDQEVLVKLIENNGKLKTFALALGKITQIPEGYIEPVENWSVGNIASDLHRLTQEVKRSEYLQEWQQNVDEIFSEKNLNKIEAAFGLNFREALEDMLYRMKNGSSRPRGLNRLTNLALNFINKGVGTIMFFNGRSAVLQTISFVNFINMTDNNLFKFGRAYANLPQFIKDFSDLFNSDYLKQRRAGMKQDLNAAEMLESVRKSKNKVSAMIAYILEKGFLPTKMADSFAIALGGAAFYRNRVNSLMKRKKMTKKQAEEQAMKDFRKIAEATQQSSRPDFISQQQASLLGHFVLAFGNTPMQYTRLQKKAALDVIKRRRSEGYDSLMKSDMANISSILYYGLVQNIIFYGLQTAMFALIFNDDEDEDIKETNKFKTERLINGMLDTMLRGTGIYGALVSMLKNYMLALAAEDKKGFSMTEANPLVEALNLSPPAGSKARLLVKAQRTWKFNKKQFGEVSYMNINHPLWDISAKYIQVGTNIPTDRILNKTKNLQEVLDNNNSAWQRFFLFMGWDRWGLYVPDRMREASKGIKNPKSSKNKTNVSKNFAKRRPK